jgi:hypothetical protein
MELITTSTPGRKRQMLLVPEINPESFLFFYEKGMSGYAYSLRHNSSPHHVSLRYARDFPWTAGEIRAKAACIYDAPYLDVTRLNEWYEYTAALNRFHGLDGSRAHNEPPPLCQERHIPSGEFPLLNLSALSALPKAAKTGDIRRMVESPQSEDWVTWNLITLLLMQHPDTWWKRLSACAIASNPELELPVVTASPRVRFWELVPSPRDYEVRHRECMRRSAIPSVAARSNDPRPVEGKSEIDLSLESDSLLIYAEAKLNADISMRTTYDPDRNQIVRNIDCLLEATQGRTPLFWMLVRDVSPARAYMQVIREYRAHPRTLASALPHRDPAVLEKLARGLTVIPWRAIVKDLCTPDASDDELLLSVKREIWFRIK